MPPTIAQTMPRSSRDEPAPDALPLQAFLKAELIDTATPTAEMAWALARVAQRFAAQYAAPGSLALVPTGVESVDLELNRIEIGSYGVRRTPECAWVYATGLAEPRFTQALASVPEQ